MTDAMLQIVWVAAHHGLRNRSRGLTGWAAHAEWTREFGSHWSNVGKLTSALGNPPAPGGP